MRNGTAGEAIQDRFDHSRAPRGNVARFVPAGHPVVLDCFTSLIVRPHAQYTNGVFFQEDLINQTMLDIDAP